MSGALPSTELAIETTGLTKRFGHQTAVDGIDLAVPHGSVFGFLGPNGSGKTTTIRVMLGLAAATSGDVRVLGQDMPASLRRSCVRLTTCASAAGLRARARTNLRSLAAPSEGAASAELRAGPARRLHARVRRRACGTLRAQPQRDSTIFPMTIPTRATSTAIPI